MNIKEASEQIEGAVRAYLSRDDNGILRIPFNMQRPIIMQGPPGIGKTAIVEQIADRMGLNFVSYSITHHTRQSALGLPFISHEEFDGEEYSVSEYTMSEILASVYRAREKSGVSEGILFLDEVNCVSETLAPAMLQFLQYKTFGMHKLPEGWVIVTAGNPPEYNRSAREFDPAMLDRLMKIDVEADLSVWQEYAVSHGVHPAILTYLESKPSNFYKVHASPRGAIVVTCRGWEDLSRMLLAYEAEGMTHPPSLPDKYLQDPEIAEDFSVYYELFRKYQDDYKITDILAGKADRSLQDRANAAAFDERVILIGMLTDANLDHAHELLEREEALELVRNDLATSKVALNTSDSPARVMQKLIRKDVIGLGGRSGTKLLSDKSVVGAIRRNILSVVKKAIQRNKKTDTDTFEIAKTAYNAECEQYEADAQRVIRGLDNSFVFLDEAFGERSQESLIFITKLSMDPLFIKVLARHGSNEFIRHSKTLLLTERGLDILNQIKTLEAEE